MYMLDIINKLEFINIFTTVYAREAVHLNTLNYLVVMHRLTI